MVRRQLDGGIKGESLTEAGFVHLQSSFIWRNRADTTWKILRQYGYGMDLKLTEEFLHPK